ncbi:MAG: phenylacetate--CoA ligase family protein [Candidatus Omnitrophica bacterium]|nr:phenylacetate--CoA ligase family protein [Candidatus Omnitrophota bacterium]
MIKQISKKFVHADLRNKIYCDWITFLKKSEKWSRDRIDEYELNSIKTIVAHAYNNVPGYRRLYQDVGLCPGDLKTKEDLRKFPFVDKETLRDSIESFTTKIRGMEFITTGGSTGIPFGFYREKAAFAKELASKAYQYYRIGWREGCRQMVFRGISIKRSSRMQFYPRFNELRCSSYYLTNENMEIYRKKAFEYRPDFLKGYPSSLYLFARYLKDSGKTFPRIKGLLCASENLYDFQKEIFKEVFNARVFSHYGHYELAVLAGFCEMKDTYHVLPQYGCAELVDKNGKPVVTPGEMGEIIGTSFLMHATPFIRYRTQDFAVLKGWGCPSCGRPYQIWERIEGRLQEFIITTAGRYISMTAINMHDDIFNHIKQFQFYQEERGRVEFRYIPKDSFNEKEKEKIRMKLLIKLGEDMRLIFKKVNDIPLSNRGKYRFLVQKLPIEFGDI